MVSRHHCFLCKCQNYLFVFFIVRGANFTFPPGEEANNAVITHNSMALQNMFGLKQHKSACLCISLILFTYLMLIMSPILPPMYPSFQWLSQGLLLALWMVTTKASLTQNIKENVNVNLLSDHVKFSLKFSRINVEEHIFGPYLLNSFGESLNS